MVMVTTLSDHIVAAQLPSSSSTPSSSPSKAEVYTTDLGPVSVAVNPTTNMVYVVNYGYNTTTVIDGRTNSNS